MAPASPCPCRSRHEAAIFIGRLSHRPVAGRDWAAIRELPCRVLTPGATRRRDRRQLSAVPFPQRRRAVAGDHQGQMGALVQENGCPGESRGNGVGQSPGNIEDQRCRRHRGARLHRSAREALRVFSPLRGSGRAGFFPPIHQRHQRRRQHARFHDRGQGWQRVRELARGPENRDDPPVSELRRRSGGVARFHWAVLKGRADLRDFIQGGFDRIPPRELQDIQARWLGSSLKFPIDPRYFYYLAVFAAGILAAAVLLILCKRMLRLRVSAKTAELSAALGSLQTQADRLRELSAHHDSVREEERAHVAREIHDELGQALTALKMDLSALGMKFGEGNPEIKARAQGLRDMVDHTIQVVRNVATALRPATLDFGILAAVESLVEEFQKRSGIRCALKVLGNEAQLAEDKSIMMFRIVQESLTNISRHAAAKNVEITVGLDATHFQLEVKDDGCGFDVEAAGRRKTFGLLGIRERVIMLHGELSIRSSPGAGTELSVSIPYQ